uniref:FSA_C domain-containing protein n=1 Tax=Mesocestoides corti TaxID=53468 RepID=A0A5K3F9I6_MESCO
MIRDLVYLTEDYCVRCCYIVVVFNYWTPFDPRKKKQHGYVSSRRLHVYFYGFDIHIFNRTLLYAELQKIFDTRPAGGCSPSQLSASKLRISSMHHNQSSATEDKQLDHQNVMQHDDTLGWIWTKFELLFPVVKFNFEMSKLCFGNQLIPRAFVLTCQKAHGIYTQEDPTWQFDKYQHWASFEFQHLIGSFVPVSKYSGHYVVEEPPQGADVFHVFNLGRGKITYKQDQPGLVSLEPEQVQLRGSDISVLRTFPKWEMAISVEKDFLLAYGPWADRQREMLWKFFFPASYRSAEVTPPATVGQLRAAQKFTLD